MTLRRIITIAGIALCSAAALLLTGVLLSILETSGFWLLPGFGLLGIIVFIESFPWLLFTVIILLTIAMFFLLGGHSARHPSRIVAILCLLILAIGFGLSRTSFIHEWQPPPPRNGLNPLLRGYGAWRFHNVFRGIVTQVQGESYVIADAHDRTFTVQLSPGTRFTPGPQIGSGDTILIIGELKDSTIRAFGIRRFP